MGLIKTIFGGIFGLIGGIFGGIAGIFGIGKKGEYFMELDEANAPATTTTSPAQPAAEPAPAVASTTTQESPAQPAPPAMSQQTATPAKPAQVTQPQAALVTNFATDYLVNPRINRSPRRRPGPSMSPFKDMVRDMSRKSPSMG
ncbi:MAG: hypothetical protein ACFB0G_09275 [Leptolyngbyaceae cyanobacterium]